MSLYFVKSLEEDYATKTIIGKEKKTFQTLDDIIAKRLIKPNTRSFGQQRRLSTTILHSNYTKTYRPQGIIFQTETPPDFVLPFDLVLLSNAENIVVHYYRIKNNLHIYYNHKLIDGYESFIYKNIELLLKDFPSPAKAWEKLNEFRISKGLPALPQTKYRLAEYDEAVFLQKIKIEPVALYGYRPETRQLAQKYGLPNYVSAKAFYERMHKNDG